MGPRAYRHVTEPPRRIPYPGGEQSVNAADPAAAIRRRGLDRYATRTWCDRSQRAGPLWRGGLERRGLWQCRLRSAHAFADRVFVCSNTLSWSTVVTTAIWCSVFGSWSVDRSLGSGREADFPASADGPPDGLARRICRVRARECRRLLARPLLCSWCCLRVRSRRHDAGASGADRAG